MATNLKIAIDLDNTLINYESVFPLAASEENLPSSISSKEDIKRYLSSSSDSHSVWLRIQGKVYGEFIHRITPDKSLLDALQTLYRNNELILVSHKTQVSFCQRYNLIQEAGNWLNRHRIHSFFHGIQYFPSKEEKMDWINNQSFDVVIDDLQDILEQLQTPIKIHFSQNTEGSFIALNQWSNIVSLLELIENKPLRKISHRTFRNGQSIIKYFPKLKERFDREVFFLDQLKYQSGIAYPHKADAISPFIKTVFKENLKSLEHIDERFCLIFISFLKDIEKNLKVNFQATHAITSYEQYINLIHERFDPDFQKIIPDITSLKESIFSRKRKTLNFISSFCFPDFSKHNFMYDGDKLFLTDFESVGNDEPVRMLLNAIHHLGHSIDKNEVTILLNAFINHYGPETKLKVQSLLDLNALDWLLIGAKRAIITLDPFLIDELNKKTKHMIECRDQGKEYWSWNQDKIYFLNE